MSFIMKKILSTILTVVIISAMMIMPNVVEASTPPYDLKYHTKEEIVEKAKELNIDINHIDTFDEEPVFVAPNYNPGSLSQESKDMSLNTLNLCRYIAGIPDDVTIDSSYEELTQAGSLVNAANDELTHYPDKPESMSQDLYDIGRTGTSRSNLFWSSADSGGPESIIFGYMDDSDAGNIQVVGHRRWILNPSMKKTAFGHVGNYLSMYAFDRSREEEFVGDYVAWPAQEHPIELFEGQVFSFSLNSRYYDAVDINTLKVTVTSETQGKTWTLTNGSSEGSLYADNNYYGMNRCVIFKVGDFKAGDTINVKIEGITKNGVESPIEYTTHLFSLTSIEPAQEKVTMNVGDMMYASRLFNEHSLIGVYNNIGFEISASNDNVEIKKAYDDYTITAKANGKTTITIKADNGAELTIDIIIGDVPLLGDVDGDGVVTIIDATQIQLYLAELKTSKPIELETADADMDGYIGICDVTVIQRYLASIPIATPVGEPIEI